MFSMKNAALVGLAAADRTLFAPVAAPYGQVTPQAYEAAAPGAYVMNAMSADAFAQPAYYEAEAPADSQTWLWAGLGALAVAGAAAARSQTAPSAVATLDEEDLESARIAMLGVGGAGKKEPWSLTSFLMSGRKGFNDGKFGELEYLSGAARAPADDPSSLNNRFKIKYDERSRKAVRPKAKPKTQKVGATWRSKNPDARLYK